MRTRSLPSHRGFMVPVMVAGVLVAAAGAAFQPGDGFGGFLVAAVFGVSLTLGGAIFLALNGVAGATWYRPIAAVPLQIARTLPVPVMALTVVMVLGLGDLYPWAQGEVVQVSELVQAKSVWLNVPFFLARAVAVLLIWFALIATLRSRLGSSADAAPAGLRGASALFLVVLAPTLSVATWDWTMSLEPEWFSTMWAVYAFAGAFVAGIAAVTLLALLLDRHGLLREKLPASVLHDLGKLLFAFTSFWAYIWFCQYMLIWYANIPEEAAWYAHRMQGSWSLLFWLNPLLNWVVPFAILMPAWIKRDRTFLAQVCIVVLAGRWLDTYLMVGPALAPIPSIPIYALAATAAMLAGMWLMVARQKAA